MMKVDSNGITIEKIRDDGVRYVRADILADTKEEVEAMTDCTDVAGLDDDDILTFHSTAFTVDKDFGILGSDGTWKW